MHFAAPLLITESKSPIEGDPALMKNCGEMNGFQGRTLEDSQSFAIFGNHITRGARVTNPCGVKNPMTSKWSLQILAGTCGSIFYSLCCTLHRTQIFSVFC